MTEDEIYRTSTQYRLWSFTPEKLASLRNSTNALAAERVKAAIKKSRESGQAQPAASADSSGFSTPLGENGQANGSAHGDKDAEVETLTVDEERMLVEYYCSQAKTIGEAKEFSFPIHVIATAVQFMKRFYLSNSPMTYHPRVIMMTSLYFATKTEPHYMGLDKYVRNLQSGLGKKKKVTNEDILAPEFILTQGIRFTFDVKHPFHALRGVHMEMQAMVEGQAALLPGEGRTAKEVQEAMQALPPKDGAMLQDSAAALRKRLDDAYGQAKLTLGSAGILTDAYFLYTPSQIMFASLLLADEALTSFYLSTKFPSATSASTIFPKVMATIRLCAEMLQSFEQLGRDELIRIDKKIYKCQNPEKVDLVSLNRAQKRDETVDGKLDESVAKRRKLEREKSMREGEDIFGPQLEKNGAGG
ncbi:cyclin-like protein [Rhizodiscina lignyota]|uniref:Cyclin-like protein n=1 Tax=Rhizodiscina lignyota TaxID=1504668 RepID=A0A9P4M0T3_9PEZI|nr:cyclin-like protein [Rhizodiscina lignyota]